MSSIALFTEDSPQDLREAVLFPWLEAHPVLPDPKAGKCVVVAPDVVRLAALKRAWLERLGKPLLGLAFWTPGELRRHLLEKLLPDLRSATAEDLALLTRLAAGETGEDDPLGVVSREPRGFLQAWDALAAARGERELLAQPWRELPTALERLLESHRLANVRAIDWRLADLPPAQRHPSIARLLLDGFSAVHAPIFPLLLAALRQSAEATMTFPLPRARAVEQLWLSSFEARSGTIAEPALGANPSLVPPPYAPWAEAAEVGSVVAAPPENLAFHLFTERRFEVVALADRAESIVRETPDAVIGLVVPNQSLLVRALAAELVKRGLPVHDSFGYFPVTEATEEVFAGWIEWQSVGQLPEAQKFLGALERAGLLEPEAGERIERAWEEARERTGSDDLTVLTAFLRGDGHLKGASEAVDWSSRWPRLDQRATIPHFLEISREAFLAWKGGVRFDEAAERWRETWGRDTTLVDRATFLEWLFGSLRVPGRARHAAARDAFAPIQLISYEMIRSAAWSHLLLGGLNEGLVPTPAQESAFLVPEAAQIHLRAVRRPGPHGEGDECLAEGRGFLFDEQARRSVQTGIFFDAIGETSARVECFATHAPEGADRSATVLSEWFLRLHRAAYGPEQPLPAVRGALRASSTSSAPPPRGWPEIEETRRAAEARSDPETPFDGHSFGFFEVPVEPLELGARDWEDLLSRPAAVWLKAMARVRPRRDFEQPLKAALTIGLGTHRLLSLPRSNENGPWHALETLRQEWPGRITAMAHAWRRAVEEAYAMASSAPPPLWREMWGKILGFAQELAEGALAAEFEGWLSSEHSLPKGARLTLADGGELRLRGRVDALFVDTLESPHRALVVDYKTGSDKPLTVKRLQKGDSLQLLLYGGALADLWRVACGLALLKPGDSASVQCSIEPGEDPSALLPGLAAVGRHGVFGFAGAVRSEYAFVGDYPITFFPPSADVVEQKWERTHGEWLPLPKGGGE
jgi:RecB family exonuclease